jgi:adenine phosphoribosyltransferase
MGCVDSALKARLIDAFRWSDPGPHSTHLVSDPSGWWRDPAILGAIGPAMAELFAADRPTVVVSPAVTGFLLGPLVATALGLGFVEAHKGGRERRIPEAMLWGRSNPDHLGRVLRLGVRAARISPDDRALLVDDWVVTGAQVGALRAALASGGTEVVGAAVIVDGCDAATARALGVRGLLRSADLPS